MESQNRRGVAYAIISAMLFGASTPLCKIIMADAHPVQMAGMLYLGSSIALGLFILLRSIRPSGSSEAGLKLTDLPWLAGATLFGGVVAPILLLFGLSSTPASTASLLLNLEAVLTALIAWFVFKENFDRRIALGMVAITIGCAILGWSGRPELGPPLGALAIGAASLGWAIDNNFTRKISASDPVQIAAAKGLVAGTVNIVAAWALGARTPEVRVIAAAGAIGSLSYGVSLTLFVLALRHLGSARTSAYFSTAPFAGAILSFLIVGERWTIGFGVGAVFMAVGLALHLIERHEHQHRHESMEHEHLHYHDEHHRHSHDPSIPVTEPHSHRHRHEELIHTHPHYPDIHHQHSH